MGEIAVNPEARHACEIVAALKLWNGNRENENKCKHSALFYSYLLDERTTYCKDRVKFLEKIHGNLIENGATHYRRGKLQAFGDLMNLLCSCFWAIKDPKVSLWCLSKKIGNSVFVFQSWSWALDFFSIANQWWMWLSCFDLFWTSKFPTCTFVSRHLK